MLSEIIQVWVAGKGPGMKCTIIQSPRKKKTTQKYMLI